MINGFTVESKMRKKYAKDIEDSYGFDSGKGILAVADGVTRDPTPVLPDLKTEEGMREFNENYPKPSPAKIAADIFSREFVEFMKKAGLCVGSVREAFEKANSVIEKWNDEHMPDVDYLVNDFAGAVAAGAIVDGKKFFYGFICDCGVVVFDVNGRVKFKTEDEGPDVLDKFIWRSDFMKGQSWRMPEGRRRIRSHFRNNPKEKYAFGVLTGQKTAMRYVRVGSGELDDGDVVILYSDGLRPIIFSDDFSVLVRERDFAGMKKLCEEKVGSEGSLVLKVV